MRAAPLPESLSIGCHGATHIIVSATTASASYCQFHARHRRRTGTSASPRAPLLPSLATCHAEDCTVAQARCPAVFRLAHLTSPDWSCLLRTCRLWTDARTAYNFSSPGDVCAHAGEGTHSCDAPVEAVPNHAWLHIVQRSQGDFVPNNAIYHALQQFSAADGEGPLDSRNEAFAAFIRDLQRPLIQTGCGAQSDPTDDTAGVRERKRRDDPLFDDADANAHSEVNQTIAPASSAMNPVPYTATGTTPSATFYFHPHSVLVSTSIPFRSTHFCVLVNIKPIVPRHLMVVPLRCVGTIHGLTEEEVHDWGHVMALTIRALDVAALLDRKHDLVDSLASAPSEGNYSIAIQQGVDAGQTVPHLHTHVIPFDPAGKLAGEPETEEQEQQRRAPRTRSQMAEETAFFTTIFNRLVTTA